jgi:general stress protein 26
MDNASNTTTEDPAKVWVMIKKIDICMFVTQSDTGPRGRPMSTIPEQQEGLIYLLTEATSSAAQDVALNDTVLLSYQSSSDHVSVAGKATVHDDKNVVKRLWSAGADAFWPDGPEAHNVVAIKVNPGLADYWDGPNPALGAVKFALGLLTKQEPDMGDRGAVQL